MTKHGKGLIFPEDNVRPMGKTAGGVRAIALDDKDEVIDMFVQDDEPFFLLYAEKDAKLVNLEDLRIWKRAKRGQSRANLKKGQTLK